MPLDTIFDGAPVAIHLGDDTAEAYRQAAAAAASASAASLAAAAALVGATYYATRAAGAAATPTGGMFTSDETGTWAYYLRISGAPNYQFFRNVLAYDANGKLDVVAPNDVVYGAFPASFQTTYDRQGNAATRRILVTADNLRTTLESQEFGGSWTQSDMHINPLGGNVGIGLGTALAPAAKVHVNGAIRISGNNSLQIFNDAESGGVSIQTDNAATPAMTFNTGGAGRLVLEGAGHLRPAGDNTLTCGSAGYRWSVVYAGTGTINTSDERDKTWRVAALSAAELSAAKRICAELGFFQWNDAIAEKGPANARYHFGARAQEVWAIMAEEGLVDPLDEDGKPGATPYAFLCFDEWQAEAARPAMLDEIGGVLSPAFPGRAAGWRFGLRIDQLSLFLAAALHQRLAALEAA